MKKELSGPSKLDELISAAKKYLDSKQKISELASELAVAKQVDLEQLSAAVSEYKVAEADMASVVLSFGGTITEKRPSVKPAKEVKPNLRTIPAFKQETTRKIPNYLKAARGRKFNVLEMSSYILRTRAFKDQEIVRSTELRKVINEVFGVELSHLAFSGTFRSFVKCGVFVPAGKGQWLIRKTPLRELMEDREMDRLFSVK